MVSSLLSTTTGVFDILETTLKLLSERPTETYLKEGFFRLGWWIYIAQNLRSQISISGEMSDALNPFNEEYHSVLHETLVYPIYLAASCRVSLNDTTLKIWTELLSTCYSTALTKLRDANSIVDSLAEKYIHQLKDFGDGVYSTEYEFLFFFFEGMMESIFISFSSLDRVLTSVALATSAMIDVIGTTTTESSTTTSAGSIKAFSKDGRQSSKQLLVS